MGRTKYTTLHGDIIEIRTSSFQIKLKETGQFHWIPVSVCEDPNLLEVEDDVDVEVATWFCEKNDLE